MVHTTAGAMWSLRVLIVYMPHIKEELLVDMIQAECKNRQDDRREIPLREISRHTQQPGQVVCASRQETGARASTMHRSMSISSQAASQSVEWNWNSQSENDAGLDTQSQSQSCNALVAVESPNQNASSSSAAASSMRMTWGTVNKSLDTCHRNHLIKRIHHLENKCSELQKELKKVKREQRIQVASRDAALQKQRGDGDDDPAHLDELVLQISKSGMRLTKKGFIAMGVRKALALTSAVGFPLTTLVDTSRQTVTRSEVSVWSMLVARSAAWHKLVYDSFRQFVLSQSQSANTADTDTDTQHRSCLTCDRDSENIQLAVTTQDLGLLVPSKWSLQHGSQELVSLGGTAFSGDATNSGIWRRNKLQSLLVTSSILVDFNKLQSKTLWSHGFAHHTTV